MPPVTVAITLRLFPGFARPLRRVVTTGLDVTDHGAQASRYVFIAYVVGVLGLLLLTVTAAAVGDIGAWLILAATMAAIRAWVGWSRR